MHNNLLALKVIFILLMLPWISREGISQKLQSDNGDGTFTNPVINADFPDPDVVLVKDTYYMVTTTMFIFPGVTVLKSKDLVNWEYCSNAVPRFDFHRSYNLDGGNRYGHGQWATSIKYHNDKFQLLFITLDEGGFLCEATNPEGPWTIRKLPKGFYDPGLFYDDDGKMYVLHGYGKIYVTKVDSDLKPVKKDSLVFTGTIRGGLEGSHAYKINGYYYLYGTYGGRDGIQVALRSKSIYGPYEQKVVISDSSRNVNFGVHQGALLKTSSGEWWTILFSDRGALGRFPSLQPVTWKDNWPMVGVEGKGVVRFRKPNVGKTYPAKVFPTSDEFEKSTLGMQWGWNHNPDSTTWSLAQRPGYLRLQSGRVVSNLREARNMLTQRIFTYYADDVPTIGLTKMDLTGMKDGNMSGMAIFQNPFAFIGVKQIEDKRFVVMVNNGIEISAAPLSQNFVYLKATVHYILDKASFSYSLDNKTFIPLGNDLEMKFNLSVFTGNKFGLFQYSTRAPKGYVDIDWFRMGTEEMIVKMRQ